MGIICCYEKNQTLIINGVHLSEIKEEKDEINEINDNKINNNDNIIVYKLNSRFNSKKECFENERIIKHKITIKYMNKRSNLINKYKFKEDKFEKFIKFTHLNQIVSSTTNSIIKN